MINFFERNTALVAPEWYTIEKTIIDKISDLFKWEIWAALSKNEVKKWYYSTPKWIRKLEDEEWFNHDFSMINEKNKVIKSNLDEIKKSISEKWWINNHNLWKIAFSYFKMWLISENDINDYLNSYFLKRAKEALHILQSPLYASFWKDWKKIRIQDYHEVDHDLNEIEKIYLAYSISNNLLSQEEVEVVEKILKKWWDNLNNFLDTFFHQFDFKNFIEKFKD